MLESLCQAAGTIHELNLDGAFPARARYRPREIYEALKRTPLFDAERGQWNEWMPETQVVAATATRRNAHDQLAGVLVEAQCSLGSARGLYEQVKATPLYDAARGRWNGAMSEGQYLESTTRGASAQLLGILVEAQFNGEGARVLYEQLKMTSLYEPERAQWNSFMSELETLGKSRGAHAQLLGVLVEAQFDPERAQVLYERLKATPLYDAGRKQWKQRMSKEGVLQVTYRHAAAQLLGVLAEAEFDPENARELYEEVKATPLYDSERRQWNECMSDDQILEHSYRNAWDQLVGILVEAKLLSTLPRPLVDAVPPLPVTEIW